MRRAARVDGNHARIVAALRGVGCSVVSLAGVGFGAPDLLVGLHGATWLLEVKEADGALRPSQVEWAARWRGAPPLVARSAAEALQALGLTGQRV